MACEDCGLVRELTPEHEKEHPNQCCDCFDQMFFPEMKDWMRTRLKPDASEETKEKHTKYWEEMKVKKAERAARKAAKKAAEEDKLN